MTLSVVIPSYCSRHLSEALHGISKLRTVSEILVVDSSPEKPELPEIPNLKLIHLERRCFPGEARNIGAKAATGELLLFLDSDVVFPEESFSYLNAFSSTGDNIWICGLYRDVEGDPLFERFQNSVLRKRVLESKERPPFFSSHFLISKKLYEHLGGFNQEMHTYEDIDFTARAEALGVRPQLEPRFEAIHLKRYSFESFFIDYFVKARNAIQARAENPVLFKHAPTFVGPSIRTAWFFSSLVPLTLLVPFLAPFFALFVFLLQNRALKPERFSQRSAYFLVWVLTGVAIAAGSVVGLVSRTAFRVSSAVQALVDLARCGWRVLFRTGWPVQLIAYVTARCNLRCEHCFYKETLDAPNPGELSLSFFEKMTQEMGPVLWFSLAGGEPFLRKDLGELIKLVQKNSRPKILSFPTNGWYTEKTFETSLRVLQSLKRGNLMLFFSLDGPKDVHDAIRGKNSFDKVKATFDRLRPLQRLYPNLFLNVVLTVTERNASLCPAFIDELVEDFRPSAISINLFRYHALEHPKLPDSLLEGYRQTVKAYFRRLQEGAISHYGFIGGRILYWKEILQKDLIYRVAKQDKFVTPCTAGTLSYVVMEDGSVKPCEILPDSIGNLATSEQTFGDLITEKKARELRRWIEDTKCKCTYECAMSTNTLFSWPMSRKLVRALVTDLVSPRPLARPLSTADDLLQG